MVIVAVDGHHNLHRCLHVPVFQKFACNGQPTGGIYGGLQAVRSSVDKFNAKECVIVWDGRRPAFRTEIYPEYKANREPKNDEERVEKEKHRALFQSQKLVLTRILRCLGCSVIEVEEAEGDDLLYALVQLRPTDKVIMISEDMDLAQLVGPNVRLYRPGRELLIDLENFEEVTGVNPAQFLVKKALVGDSSDNIKGIDGIGEKRATAVLQECTADLYTYCMGHKSVPVRRIAENMNIIERNLRIMDLQRFPWSLDRLREVRDQLDNPPALDEDAVRLLFETLQFQSLLEYFSAWITPFKLLRR